MPDIVLATLNAKYIHAAFGLRYLLANLGDLRPRAACSSSISTSARSTSPKRSSRNPENHRPRRLHLERHAHHGTRLHPQTHPAGHHHHPRRPGSQLRNRPAAHRRAGRLRHHRRSRSEIRRSLPSVARRRKAARRKSSPPNCPTSHNSPRPTNFTPTTTSRTASFTSRPRAAARSPASSASRRSTFPCASFRCPHCCNNLEELLDRGVRQFKFVDRTFNLNLAVSKALPAIFSRPPSARLVRPFRDDSRPPARARCAKSSPNFRPARCNSRSASRPSIRRSRNSSAAARITNGSRTISTFSAQHTGVHVHADLIVGLPGETVESFGTGFDRLVALRPAGNPGRHSQTAARHADRPPRLPNGRWFTARIRRTKSCRPS